MRTKAQKFIAACTLVLIIGGMILAIIYLAVLFALPRASEAQDASAVALTNRVAFSKMITRSAQPSALPQTVIVTNPQRLVIPALGVDAAIQNVGKTASGKMGTPKGDSKYKDVAWYEQGFKPGENGNAVIAGHLDNGYGLSAVFKKLDSLEVGDSIFILGDSGRALHFKVKQKSLYPYNSDPGPEVFGKNTEPMLNLITCDGDWIESARGYSQRLVVYTELVR